MTFSWFSGFCQLSTWLVIIQLRMIDKRSNIWTWHRSLVAPVVITTFITLSFNNIQSGHILVLTNSSPPGKWPLKQRLPCSRAWMWLPVHKSNFGQMPFLLPPPITHTSTCGSWTQVHWVQVSHLKHWTMTAFPLVTESKFTRPSFWVHAMSSTKIRWTPSTSSLNSWHGCYGVVVARHLYRLMPSRVSVSLSLHRLTSHLVSACWHFR